MRGRAFSRWGDGGDGIGVRGARPARASAREGAAWRRRDRFEVAIGWTDGVGTGGSDAAHRGYETDQRLRDRGLLAHGASRDAAVSTRQTVNRRQMRARTLLERVIAYGARRVTAPTRASADVLASARESPHDARQSVAPAENHGHDDAGRQGEGMQTGQERAHRGRHFGQASWAHPLDRARRFGHDFRQTPPLAGTEACPVRRRGRAGPPIFV